VRLQSSGQLELFPDIMRIIKVVFEKETLPLYNGIVSTFSFFVYIAEGCDWTWLFLLIPRTTPNFSGHPHVQLATCT
jgi:hypothetical protein